MVELGKLQFGYGSETLFRDTNLTLEPGAIYGLLGLNGAGKSTLLRLIAGLLFPASGRVSVLGHEPARRKPAFLSSLFVLPEELNVPGITDREYISARAPFYPDFDRPRLERHLEELEVPQRAEALQPLARRAKEVPPLLRARHQGVIAHAGRTHQRLGYPIQGPSSAGSSPKPSRMTGSS